MALNPLIKLDYFWNKLFFVSEVEQCGWLKDQFRLFWQIIPSNINEVLMNGTKEEIKNITEAFLKMKKFDFALLEKAPLGD